MALLTAPLAFTFFDAHDEDGAPVADPVALLEALRRHAERVTLFCQAGAIGVPRPDQKLLAYLEGSVIEVQAKREGGIFHPKVWVLNFESEKGPAIYRVLCLSRNLTFARAWDTCLRLEGRLAQRELGYSRNKPFADLLLALPGFATRRPIRDELQEDLERMAYEVRRVDFEPPRPFENFNVHNFGLRGRRGWPFPKGGRSLVVSPFLAGSTVRDTLCGSTGSKFSSRDRRPSRMPPAEQDVSPYPVCVTSSHPEPVLTRVIQRGRGRNLPTKRHPAKVRRNSRVSTPSCSCSRTVVRRGCLQVLRTPLDAALHVNVEVLVELVGKTKDCGIDALLGLEEDPRLETLRSLLQEYHPPERLGPEPCDRKLEAKVDRLARTLAAVPLTAHAHHVDADQRWDMTVLGELPDIPVAAEVKVWPATLPSEAASLIDGRRETQHGTVGPAGPAYPIAKFREISFEALTAFLAFEVTLREGGHEARKRFAVTAELIGAPENRKEQLLRSLLEDSGRVLQLLFLILMGEGADVSAFERAARSGGPARQGSIGGWDQAALLETLLRCLSRNPRRIDEVARLISDLERTPEGRNLLPEGLKEIWEPVWEVREALRS